jgi:hypothetical protein
MPELRQALAEMLDAARKRQTAGQKSALSPEAAKLLKLMTTYPYIPAARLFEQMGQLSFKRQRSIRKELEDRELANFEETRIGKTNVLLVEATEAGYAALALEIDRSGNRGRGTLTHRSYAHWIKWHFERQGFTATIEGIVLETTHPADVLVQSTSGRYLAVEICITSSDNLLSHIQACFEKSHGIDGMIVIASTKGIAQQLKQQIYDALALKAYVTKIEFETVEGYVPRKVEP